MRELIRRCLRAENGATAIEYALIAAFVATLIIAAVTLVGTDFQAIFKSLANAL